MVLVPPRATTLTLPLRIMNNVIIQLLYCPSSALLSPHPPPFLKELKTRRLRNSIQLPINQRLHILRIPTDISRRKERNLTEISIADLIKASRFNNCDAQIGIFCESIRNKQTGCSSPYNQVVVSGALGEARRKRIRRDWDLRCPPRLQRRRLGD